MLSTPTTSILRNLQRRRGQLLATVSQKKGPMADCRRSSPPAVCGRPTLRQRGGLDGTAQTILGREYRWSPTLTALFGGALGVWSPMPHLWHSVAPLSLYRSSKGKIKTTSNLPRAKPATPLPCPTKHTEYVYIFCLRNGVLWRTGHVTPWPGTTGHVSYPAWTTLSPSR